MLALVLTLALIPDHTALVVATKATVTLDLSTPCGGFEIAKRVAWALREEGAGNLAKLRGDHPDGDSLSPYGCWVDGVLYAYDIVIYPDGRHYDILSGGDLNPLWHLVLVEGTTDPYLRPESYHAPLGAAPLVATPLPIVQGPKGDKGDPGENADASLLADLVERLMALETKVAALEMRVVPTACVATLNLGVARIPVSCRLQ